MADSKRREITIVLTGDAKGLTGTVAVIKQQMKDLGGSFDVVSDKAKGAGKAIDSAAKDAEKSAVSAGKAIGLAVGATGAGFAALVKRQLDVADSTGKMAQRFGVSTEFISSMGYAAKSSGADLQVLDTSLQALADSQTKAAAGQKQYAAAFAALNVPVKDASGNLRSLADMLPDLADRFRRVQDGPNKAALAVKLFGSEGAKLIPMLNQGKEGLAAMAAEAEKLGLMIDQNTAAQATELNDRLARMKNLAAGAANTFLKELLPSLLDVGSGMGDANEQADRMNGIATVLANAMKGLAVAIDAVVVAVKAIATAVAAAVEYLAAGLTTINKNTTAFFTAAKTAMAQSLHFDVKGVVDTWSTAFDTMASNTASGFARMKSNTGLFVGDIKDLWSELKTFTDKMFPSELAKANAAVDAQTKALADQVTAGAHKLGLFQGDINPGTDWAARIGKMREAAKAALPDLTSLANMVDKLKGEAGSPYDKADAAYIDSIRDLAKKAGDEITKAQDAVKKGHMSVADAAAVEASAQKLVAEGITAASAARDDEYTKIKRQLDVSGRLIEQLQQEAWLSTLSDRDQAIARAGLEYEQDARTQNLKLTRDQLEAEKQRVEAAAGASFDMKQMADEQRQIAQEYAGFWENAAGSISKAFGDLITGQTKSWKDFGKSLKSIARQFVSDLISQFVRLRILGPLLSGAMGSIAGWLGVTGSLAGSSLSLSSNYYGNGGTIGTTAGAVGGNAGGGGSQGYMGFVQQGLQGYKAYQWASTGGLWGGAGTSSLSAQAGSNALGINLPNGQIAYAGSNGIMVPGGYSPLGGSFGLGGYAAPWASAGGGLLGAYYGYNHAGGGIGGLFGAAGYGALGAGLAGTAAGVAGGASLGTAAGGAFGAAAGASWIPVAGWSLAALGAIDALTGGGLFGTGYKPTGSDTFLQIGAGGASASSTVYESGKKALFGGTKHRSEQVAPTQDMIDAANALYDSVEKVLVQGAQKLGVAVPEMISASLQSHYDVKSKATTYMVNYLGQTWKEATADAAAQRIGAEALLSVIAASAGDVANKIAKQWQSNVDTLADGVAAMLAAQQDILHGNSLVALGSQATLAQVIAFTQSLQADGEKLADTYNRLMQASQAYVQFVGQFAPVSTGFGASLEAIAKQMQANIDQANDLARAAGMQGAAEQDLVNIHQFAAKQAADAIAQLSSAAQDLAAKLYNVTGTSLQAVQAQLDAMQSKTQSALQLAIGDKSPLSGKEKLDLALQGLRSGLTSADDVLGLGRQLYASSADYTGLYNKVQDILGLSGTGGQLSVQDAIKQYADLAGQRDQLQAQANATARFADAKTLAQYVADISTTHGIDYNEAAKGLGFNLGDLAKDLGITNIAGYLDSLKLQDVPGSVLDASGSIVDAIQKLGRDLIATITGAPITTATGVSANNNTSSAEQLALLKSIDQRLAAIEGSSSSTANTNKTMAAASTRQALDQLALTGRGITA